MMADDSYETVAVTYSQPETAVMLSMFAWYGIPAYALGSEHARIAPYLTVGLGGMPIRVHPDALEDARELLAEVAARPQAVRPRIIDNPATRLMAYAIAFFFSIPLPTRTGSTYFLGGPRPGAPS
jgi:hypothetical protein